MKILHSGRTEPVGEVALVSSGKVVKVERGSGMLLRVDRSGSAKQPGPRLGRESHDSVEKHEEPVRLDFRTATRSTKEGPTNVASTSR